LEYSYINELINGSDNHGSYEILTAEEKCAMSLEKNKVMQKYLLATIRPLNWGFSDEPEVIKEDHTNIM
jgi:hypothetical protein